MGISSQLVHYYTHHNVICIFSMWVLVVRSCVLHCAVPLLFFFQCLWIIGSNNYIHLCPTVEAIYNRVTVVMTKSFIIRTTKQHLHIKLWWCGCRNVCLFCTFFADTHSRTGCIVAVSFVCVCVCACIVSGQTTEAENKSQNVED